MGSVDLKFREIDRKGWSFNLIINKHCLLHEPMLGYFSSVYSVFCFVLFCLFFFRCESSTLLGVLRGIFQDQWDRIMELYEQQKAAVEWKGGDVMLTKLGGWTSPNMEMVEVSQSHRIPRWWFL